MFTTGQVNYRVKTGIFSLFFVIIYVPPKILDNQLNFNIHAIVLIVIMC